MLNNHTIANLQGLSRLNSTKKSSKLSSN